MPKSRWGKSQAHSPPASTHRLAIEDNSLRHIRSRVMDRFEAMRAYVQIVDSGSFTKGAQQLNLHKATLSQQIRQLEDKLGTRLLTRTTRSIAPTSEGLAYYQHA